jgi:uncharacterized membrane-anchored protein YhcB (DUF1043 family)
VSFKHTTVRLEAFMSFLRNSDVKKHLARSVLPFVPKIEEERLATPAEIASARLPKKEETAVFPIRDYAPAKPDVR